jgi:RNA polymerase sigma factor (sigma-70 family)
MCGLPVFAEVASAASATTFASRSNSKSRNCKRDLNYLRTCSAVFGARGPNRTDTTLRSADFESAASTSSATRACGGANGMQFFGPCCDLFQSWRILGGMSRFLDVQIDPNCLQLAAGGDRAAQRHLYEQLAGPMFALAQRVLRDRSAAEDAFQDSMMALLRHLPDFRGDAPVGAWARQITLNHCLAHLRSPWQKARSALRDWAGSDDAVSLDAVQTMDPPLPEHIDLERALQALGDTPRAVLWLHDVEGLTHAEIGAAFGRSTSFSKSQLARAHALLRVQLVDEPGGATPVSHPEFAAQGQVS